MAVTSKSSRTQPFRSWLLWSFLLLVLTNCGTGQNAQGSSVKPQPTLTNLTLQGTGTSTSSRNASGIRPFIDTWNNIHLAQNFDYTIANPAPIAHDYDFVWGDEPGKLAIWRANNPNIVLSYYFSFYRDSGTFGNLNAEQTLSYWAKVHSDWILYQCDRKTPAYEDGLSSVPLNFTNPAVIAWELQTYGVLASRAGYDAIAADNLNMENLIGACGYYKNGQWVQLFSGKVDDQQWQTGIAFWVTTMQKDLHSLPHPLALIPNLSIGNIPVNNPLVQQVLEHIDGALNEGGFTRYGQGYLTGTQWLATIQLMESMQQQQKADFLVNECPTVDKSHIQWILASYLMGKEHMATISITPVQGYGTDLRYSEYSAQIGSPSGAMYLAQKIYWRNYTHGLSLVNPDATQTYTITLPKGSHYVDLYGNQVTQQVSLPPHSGMVLLTVAA